VRRREFITLVGGAAMAWPLAVRAQQSELRRIGVLQPFPKDMPEKVRIEAFLQELQRLGRTDGRNLQIEYRWQASDLQKAAMELVPHLTRGALLFASIRKSLGARKAEAWKEGRYLRTNALGR